MGVEVDNFLEHHGVPGMKWGKHKSKSSSSSVSSRGAKTAVKVERKAVRKEMLKDAISSTKAHKGRAAAGLILVGPSATAGMQLARSAGHSKGASVAIGMLGGAPGGVLAVHLAARKAVREA